MTESNNNNDQNFPRSRVKKQSNRVLYLFIIAIAFLTGGFYFYQKNLQTPQEDPVAGKDMTADQIDSSITIKNNISALPQNGSPVQTDMVAPFGEAKPLNPDSLKTSSSSSNSNLAKTSAGNEDVPDIATAEDDGARDKKDSSTDHNKNPAVYAEQIEELNAFYEHLDAQQYMQDFKLTEPSKAHFSKLIQKLIDNPPTVTRETDDLFTLLKNTAHFFRIIGKDNILVLKGILDREKDSFESVLQSLYILTHKPEIITEEYSVTLDPDSLYDYACFFLNTMGGRLYLFRRDSNSRMAVSFYAIAIIDRANEAGNSRHGIDIRPGIDSLIEEIENGGKKLRMREYYLDTLYDLKVKYD